MMRSVDYHMTAIYCFVDEFFKGHARLAQWRRSPHAQPQFSDAEVLTVALLQGVLEVATLKQTYRLVAQNWRAAFPHLPSYKQWVSRLHHLLPLVGQLLGPTCGHALTAARLYLIDSKPIPLCQPIRHGRVRLLRDEGAYFGKTRKGWFFGFKLHLLRHIDGRVLNVVLTPGNWNDRDPALALVAEVDGGITLGDAGYRSAPCAAHALADRSNMWHCQSDQIVSLRRITANQTGDASIKLHVRARTLNVTTGLDYFRIGRHNRR